MKTSNIIYHRICLSLGVCLLLMVFEPSVLVAQTQTSRKVSVLHTLNDTIKFTVYNGATNKPLPGASVTIKGTLVAAMTDDAGEARLAVPTSNLEVSIKAPGFETVSIGTRSRNKILVSLNPLMERALPIGESVAGQSMSDMSGQLLAITRSGIPGIGDAVFIDGIHSINTSSQPLYVVDGQVWQPYENSVNIIDGFNNSPISLIDPKDIESINIIRDGSAIYGAKGGNGVVHINTHRAHNQATVIEAFANLGIRQKVKSIPVMDAASYRLYATDVLAGKFTNSSMLENFKFINDDKNSSNYLNSHANVNWFDRISRNAALMNYGINVRGGDERALYAFSFGYTKNEAPIKETSFDRLNIRFNSDINLWAALKLRFDVAFAQGTTHMFNDGLNEISSPYYMSLIKSPLYSANIYSPSGELTDKLSDVDELGIGNPLAIIDMAQGESRNYRFNLIATPSYKFNDKWTAKGMVGYIFDKDNENTFLPDYGAADEKLVNNTGEIYGTVKQNVKNLMNRRTTFSTDLHVEYTPFNDYVNRLSFLGGYRFQNDTWIMSYGQGYNTGSDYVNDLKATDSNLYFSDGHSLEWRNMSWYLLGDYSWYNRYFLSLGVVMESSSRFGKDVSGAVHLGGISWGVFPYVNAAWMVSNENFMIGASAINQLKLRMSYLVTGNDNLPLGATSTYFTSAGLVGNSYGYVLANIGNEKLKWENTGTLRLGIDGAMFDNLLSFGLEGYVSNTDNLLLIKQLQDVAGLKNYWTNGGSLRNQGVNFSAKVRVVNTRDWQLNVSATIGTYKNKVTSLSDGNMVTDIAGGRILTAVGHPVGVFYGYKTVGVFSTSNEAKDAGLMIRNNDGSSSSFASGDMHFVDKNGDKYIDDEDRFIIGDPTPDFYGNVNFCLSWKKFTLGSVFTYSKGNEIYNALLAKLESGSDVYNQSTAMINRWRANGQISEIPRASYGDPMGNSRFSDRWIEDGSFLKWKTLSLSYNLPVRSAVVNGLTFTLSMNNIMTLTKYLGVDPECYSGTTPLYMGVDAGLLPLSREFYFGVKINL